MFKLRCPGTPPLVRAFVCLWHSLQHPNFQQLRGSAVLLDRISTTVYSNPNRPIRDLFLILGLGGGGVNLEVSGACIGTRPGTQTDIQ